ncbi:MAG: M24 family metallopeptidase [Thermomicrobiales bacterium]
MVSEIGMERIERLREGMRERAVDVLICLKPQNSFYLSGFNPIIYSHPVVAILPLEGESVLLVHALRDDHARQSAWVRDVRLYGAWSTKQTMGPDWLLALHAILEERGVARGTIGIEGDFLPLATAQQWEALLSGARFVDAADLIMNTRMVKEPIEIEYTRAASAIADIGMEAALATAAERLSERDISIRAMAAMNQVWADDFPNVEVADFGGLEGGVQNGLWCYCLTGDHVLVNCDNPTTRRLADGELALIVIWTNCNGLHAENERTVAVGTLDDARRAAFEAVLQIREETWSAFRPGATCADVYNAARTVYEQLGYGKYLPGRIGHGLGLGPHEPPSLGPRDSTVLRPGMIFTLEPNLRIPELGGVQHSDTLIVTGLGYEVMTTTRGGYIEV